MECVPGRVIMDSGASLSLGEKSQLWASMAQATADLHSADFRKVGLEGYGKVGNYASRQLKTWSRNFFAANEVWKQKLKAELTEAVTDDMTALINYLEQNMVQ